MNNPIEKKCKTCYHYDPVMGACMHDADAPVAPIIVTVNEDDSCICWKTKEMVEKARQRVHKNPEGWEDA